MNLARLQVYHSEVTLTIVQKPADLIALLHHLKKVMANLDRTPVFVGESLGARYHLKRWVANFLDIKALIVRESPCEVERLWKWYPELDPADV